MKKQLYLIVLLLCIIFLAGCSSTIGKVASVEYKANNKTIIQFEDGRTYTFTNRPDKPIHEGAYITIEYMENTIGIQISSITDHSDHAGNSNCPAHKYKLQSKPRKSHSSKSNLDIIICPRCQHTLRKGVDY